MFVLVVLKHYFRLADTLKRTVDLGRALKEPYRSYLSDMFTGDAN